MITCIQLIFRQQIRLIWLFQVTVALEWSTFATIQTGKTIFLSYQNKKYF